MSCDFSRPGRPRGWLSVVLWLVATLVLFGHPDSAAAQAPSAGQSVGLQKLVDELSDQFWFAYRGNIPEHRLRHDQLRQAIEAWNQAPKTTQNRGLMVQWLHESMVASMPGARQPLPPLPDFGSTVLPAPSSTATSSAAAPAPAAPAPRASQSTTSNKPVVKDQPAESTPGQAADEQDYWFSQQTEQSPAETDTQSSDDFWEAYPADNNPAPAGSPGSDPFGDDPVGP